MLVKNIALPEQTKGTRQISYKGATPEKVFSLLANPDSLARTIALETAVTGGRSANAYKRGGYYEFREAFTDNLISAIFWMKGVDIFNSIGNWIGKNILKLPTTEFDVGKDALRTPFNNIATDLGKKLSTEEAKALEKKLATFKFSKIIASTLLATGFVGFALPKINQAITRSMMNSRLKDTFKDNKKKSKTDNIYKPYTMDNFAKQLEMNNKATSPSFKGLSPQTIAATAHLLENNPIVKMLTCDVGILSGRMVTARNADEGREYLFRDTTSSFFYMASTPLVYMGLQKLFGNSSITSIDPLAAKQLNEKLIEIVKTSENGSIPVQEFAKKTIGNANFSVEDFLSKVDFEKNITAMDKIKKSVLEFFGKTYTRSTSGDVISLEQLKKVITDEKLFEKAKEMAKLQPEKAGVGAVLTKQQVRDVLTGGEVNSPSFLMNVYKTKFGEALTNPYKYISSAKITKFKDNIDNYMQTILESAKQNNGVVDEKLLNNIRNKSFRMSKGFRIIALGFSAVMLGIVIPKLQHKLTVKKTGVYAAPGLREFEQANKKEAEKV